MGNQVTKDQVKAMYSIKEKLGEGNFAAVHRCVRRSDNAQFAVKIIKKKNLDKTEMKLLHDEHKIMEQIQHPNCARLYETFETDKKLYMVLELLTGGELFDRIVEKGSYSEKEAAEVIRQCAGALEYLHQHGVAHRDLKPENLIYADKTPNSALKITDFGLAKYRSSEEQMLFTTQCGTPGYVAPEVLLGQEYTAAVDMWSLGVILYILLCGYPPFYAENNKELYRQIKKAQYEFHADYWGAVSAEAKDLVRRLLTVDPTRRLTAAQVKQHPWVANSDSASTRDLGQSQRLNRTKVRAQLRRGVQTILAVNRFRGIFKNMSAQQDAAGGATPAPGAASSAAPAGAGAGPAAGAGAGGGADDGASATSSP